MTNTKRTTVFPFERGVRILAPMVEPKAARSKASSLDFALTMDGRGAKSWLSLALAVVTGLALYAFSPALTAQPAMGRWAAATESLPATREALSQMRAGGNAVDAAVAAALVGGVTAPSSSGMGGGGFALVWLGGAQRAFLLDFRETAPSTIDVEAFERRPLPDSERGRLVGVPGEAIGLYELQRRFGKRPWKDVVAPAARVALHGYAVENHLAQMLAVYGKALQRDAQLMGVFFPGGRAAVVGRVIKNPELGATLSRLAAEGPKAIYSGAIARELVAAARPFEAALSTTDLERYRPVERQPLEIEWEGYRVLTMPPPSAGGLLLAQTLRLYSKEELSRLGFGTGAYQHMLAEAFRGAIADRLRFIADPGQEHVDIAALISSERMARRKARLALDRTHGIPRFALEGGGTHHLVTADAAGNVVSLTTTVNNAFGAKISGPTSGVVLNDELDDFTQRKDVAPLGLKQSLNRPRPGARPVSSMMPTLVVKDGRVVLALGGSGGPTIPTNVTQMLLARLVFGLSPQAAIASPRFQVPTEKAYVLLEKNAPPELVADLSRRGEIVDTTKFTSSAVQMIAIEGDKKIAVADPRKQGSALTAR